MKRESITALRWYFLNCSVTQFYWVQVFSSPKYIHVSEESSTNLLLINKLLLTKDEGPNSYKQYLRGCRMILSQIFSFFSSSPPPLPPCLLLFLSTQFQGCSANGSQLLLGLAPTAARTPILILTQPNPDRTSPEIPGSGAPISPHTGGPYRTLTSKISLDPYSFTRQKPSSGAMPTVALLPRLREVVQSLPILHPSPPAGMGRVRSGAGEIAVPPPPGVLLVISHLFNPAVLLRNLGKGGTC